MADLLILPGDHHGSGLEFKQGAIIDD